MHLFGGKKTPPPAPAPPPEESAPDEHDLKLQLSQKVIEIYPITVKLLWHFYNAQDQGKEEGRMIELPGPIDDTVTDSVKELEREYLLEIVPTFSDFGITAKLTRLGLQIMASQTVPGHLSPVTIPNENTGSPVVYKELDLSV
jgi:hypothetical protein